MKKFNYFAISLSLLAAIATSCSKDEDLDDVTIFGTVTASRDLPIATGQLVTLEVPITINSGSSATDIVSWYNDGTNDALCSGSLDGNIASVTTSWSQAGDTVIQCRYNYDFDGNNQTMTFNYNVTVVHSHFLNSRIGESKALVLFDNPDIEEYSEDVYSKTVDGVSYYFQFTDDIFTCGTTEEVISTTEPGAALGLLTYEYTTNTSMLNTSTVTYHSSYNNSYSPTTEVDAAISEFTEGLTIPSDESIDIICAAIDSEDISYIGIKADIIDDDSVERFMQIARSTTDADSYILSTTTSSK